MPGKHEDMRGDTPGKVVASPRSQQKFPGQQCVGIPCLAKHCCAYTNHLYNTYIVKPTLSRNAWLIERTLDSYSSWDEIQPERIVLAVLLRLSTGCMQ